MWNNDEYVENGAEIERPKEIKQPRSIPTLAPGGVGLVIMFLGLLLEGDKLPDESIFLSVIGVVTPFLFATTGILIMVRKESPRPGLSSITGWGAILTGLLATLLFGSMGVVMLIDLISGLISK